MMRFKPQALIIALLMAFWFIAQGASRSHPEEEHMLHQLSSAPFKPEVVADVTTPQEELHYLTPLVNCDSALESRVQAVKISQKISDRAIDVSTDPLLQDTSGQQKRYAAVPGYKPREVVRLADPSNYGDRYRVDINGRPVNNEFVVVLHETVYSADSAINYFQTPHPRDEDQASYHTLIKRDGTIIYVVPPEKRAFGAGNSVFVGPRGPEAVKTDPVLPPSVNNFAYHSSLETPSDGANDNSGHSGYTDAQYQSLGWLIAKTSVPEWRITTHKAIDRSGSRHDPRTFNREKFLGILRSYPRRIRTASGYCASPVVAASQESDSFLTAQSH
jgi:Tfp pilus assembly protein PilX